MRERIILQTSGALDCALREAGSLVDWQHEVGRYAVYNSRLALAISAAFAAPLLYPTGSEGGGYHFRGGSSTGKTTALIVAGSAFGGGRINGYIRPWRATSNGLEGVAAMHCDCLLCLDEMGEVDSREVGQVAYMLANGVGKIRANRNGEARPPAEWRLLFLSSGEHSLADKIAEDGRGRRVAAGQEVRIVDLPADAGAGYGIFENLHGFSSADALARHLKLAALKHYGHPIRKYLQHLVNNFDEISPTARVYVDDFLANNCPSGSDGQVSRVAARFGLVAAGGEIATKIGVLPWPTGEATRAAARCFHDWLVGRGGTEPSEERDAVSAVRRFIELHGRSRFETIRDRTKSDSTEELSEQRVQNRAGFFRRNKNGEFEYLVLPEVWRSEICRGLDATFVAKILADRGLLIPGSGGKFQNFQRVPGSSNPIRCYILTATILGGDISIANEDII